MKIEKLDDEPLAKLEDDVIISGITIDQAVSSLHGDEHVGAYGATYNGGSFFIYPNVREYDVRTKNFNVKKLSFISRWFFRLGLGKFSFQANYGGGLMVGSCFTRSAAIVICKRWIDEYKRTVHL